MHIIWKHFLEKVFLDKSVFYKELSYIFSLSLKLTLVYEKEVLLPLLDFTKVKKAYIFYIYFCKPVKKREFREF